MKPKRQLPERYLKMLLFTDAVLKENYSIDQTIDWSTCYDLIKMPDGTFGYRAIYDDCKQSPTPPEVHGTIKALGGVMTFHTMPDDYKEEKIRAEVEVDLSNFSTENLENFDDASYSIDSLKTTDWLDGDEFQMEYLDEWIEYDIDEADDVQEWFQFSDFYFVFDYFTQQRYDDYLEYHDEEDFDQNEANDILKGFDEPISENDTEGAIRALTLVLAKYAADTYGLTLDSEPDDGPVIYDDDY